MLLPLRLKSRLLGKDNPLKGAVLVEINKRNLLISLAYVVPALIFMLVLIGYPLFYNIKISFQHLDLMTLNNPDVAFAGLENYRKVIGLDSFHIAFKNTFSSRFGAFSCNLRSVLHSPCSLI